MNPEAVGEHLELLIVVVIRCDDLYKAYLRLRNYLIEYATIVVSS